MDAGSNPATSTEIKVMCPQIYFVGTFTFYTHFAKPHWHLVYQMA
jgi:hypothetical protein